MTFAAEPVAPTAADVEHHLLATVGTAPAGATPNDIMHAVAQVAREQLSRRWVATDSADRAAKARRVYYLSMEFLIGRTLSNALAALDLQGEMATAARQHACTLEEVATAEADAALGNGGLGRLAACFLDSMATLELPSFGYGIRYEFGMFKQSIQGGRQVEHPDPWLEDGTPWEFPRPGVHCAVCFGGWVEHPEGPGTPSLWRHAGQVNAKAYDMVIPGHGTERVSTLRLWKAAAPSQIDLHAFNTGDYARAAEFKNQFENISWVLYPNDSTDAGRELRLRQEYFFTSASLQDILARHQAEHGRLTNLAEKVAIHLNDTHPAIGVAELMRVFVDEKRLPWDEAWDLTTRTFGYTNHTLLAEALEKWPVTLFERLLPRHLQIIYEVNQRFLRTVEIRYPFDSARLERLSLIEEGKEKSVRMAHLAVVGSHSVNGVAELHTSLLKQDVLKDFHELYPERFNNKTNGVTPRRWLVACNPRLTKVITSAIGDGWIADLDKLKDLEKFASDASFVKAFRDAKRGNKEDLSAHLRDVMWASLDPSALFDVQIKRLHEYKRQLLNALHIVRLWMDARRDPSTLKVPRAFLFGAKSAPGYKLAKLIIRLITGIADVVNSDAQRTGLRVAFVPNYRVSMAERIIPAADLSEQISTAGMEASGTGNMKLSMNGALTIGTLDGANVEIRDAVGPENFFLFGMTAPEVAALKRGGYRPRDFVERDEELRLVLDALLSGEFSGGDPELFRGLVGNLLESDPFCVLADYRAYVDAQAAVEQAFRNEDGWTKASVLNVARVGRFSSDRSIDDYARDICHVKPAPVPPVAEDLEETAVPLGR